MKNKRNFIFVSLYFAALIASNLIVQALGPIGIWIASFFLIPFDFICRCIFHETWGGWKLIRNLLALTIASAVVTIALNHEAFSIALASVCAIISVQIFAGIIYQIFKKKDYLIKVNLADLAAVIVDSIVFQLVAFSVFDWHITVGQIVIKAAGGFLWYFIIFRLIKLKF